VVKVKVNVRDRRPASRSSRRRSALRSSCRPFGIWQYEFKVAGDGAAVMRGKIEVREALEVRT